MGMVGVVCSLLPHVLVSSRYTWGQDIHLTSLATTLRSILALKSTGRVHVACVSSPTDQEVSRGSQQNDISLFAATSKQNIRNVDQRK